MHAGRQTEKMTETEKLKETGRQIDRQRVIYSFHLMKLRFSNQRNHTESKLLLVSDRVLGCDGDRVQGLWRQGTGLEETCIRPGETGYNSGEMVLGCSRDGTKLESWRG